MDYSISWLFEEKRKYQNLVCNDPYSPSDWYNELNDDLIYPIQPIIDSHKKSIKKSYQYSFMSSVDEYKCCLTQYFINTNNFKLDPSNIAICNNATSAIYLSLKALLKLGVRRFLVITPVYFSVLNILKSYETSIIYYHLMDIDKFSLDLNKFENTIKEQYIEAIILTDPVFCTGKDYTIEKLTEIIEISKRLGIWLFCDHTLGGMFWDQNVINVLNFKKIIEVSKYNKIIFIDSIVKKLFLNGLKFALIISNKTIIDEIEELSEDVIGGLNQVQIAFFEQLFNGKNDEQLIDILKNNVSTIKKNYNQIRSLLINEKYSIFPPDSGFFTIITHKKYRLIDKSYKEIVKKILYKEGILILPLCRFSFYEENHFGFRVNLSKQSKKLLPAISKSIRVNF